MAPVVEVDGLRKSYGGVERLHGISFQVDAGEILGFLGTNGAGKTTTIEILEGYRDRDSGRVSVLGVDPAHGDRAWRNRIGLVLQEAELDPVYTVRETVAMFARYFSQPSDPSAIIAAVGLAEKANDRIGHLSGGQKRLVDVALGLVGNPEILFLDEPTTGLDPAARREMWTLVEGLRAAGKTIFLTTHYMDEAQHLADRILILRAGEVAACGTVEELSRQVGGYTEISFAAPPGLALSGLPVPAGGGTWQLDGAVVRLRSHVVPRDLAALLGWADRERVELVDLQAVKPTLDDVFVRFAEAPGAAEASADDGVRR
ncbi:MAG: ATP-binding cassette domain-containing protein [Acidimicrobiales bacterium]